MNKRKLALRFIAYSILLVLAIEGNTFFSERVHDILTTAKDLILLLSAFF